MKVTDSGVGRAILPARANAMDVAGLARPIAVQSAGAGMLRRFGQENACLRPSLEGIRVAADALTATSETLDSLREVYRFLTEQLMPHGHAKKARLYPALA